MYLQRNQRTISHATLISITALFLVLLGNFAFAKNVIKVYPVNTDNIVFLLSLIVLFTCANIILACLVCFKKTTKPILITVVLISSSVAYFMDTYNIIIDDTMIDNIVSTDRNEAMDLFSYKQVIYLILLGIVPSVLIYKTEITPVSWIKTILINIGLLLSAIAIFVGVVLSLSDFYSSFFRENKPLRFYANPSYYIYSTVKYINTHFDSGPTEFKKIALDAKRTDTDNRRLVITVIGEAARADHFSLNGYQRETNPLLEQYDVINYSNAWACGTSTAYSVPCLFSSYNRTDFNKTKARSTENLLDILDRLGVHVAWLDNNSDAKGVADRIGEQNYKLREINPVCDNECRDVGMLTNLQDYVDSHQQGDIFIVLHQLGNHGPAYYKRYPKQFEKFTPTCQTNQLEQCSRQEVINAYDNTLLYTDYFLSETIEFLKRNNAEFKTALVYASDHGESLGEHNLYLHGLPYAIAPDEQLHIPIIIWMGDRLKQTEFAFEKLKAQANERVSHDNLFHTLLRLMAVETSLYDQQMDLTHTE